MKRQMAGLLEAPATTSGGGGGSDLRTAFRSAVASATAGKDVTVRHRASAKDVETDEDASAGDDDAGDPDAEDDEQDDQTDEGADEQDDDADDTDEETGDDADDADEDDTDDEADETDEDDDEEDEDTDDKPAKHALNDEREFRKLQDQYKDDPKGLRKELLKTFTQKTQDIAKKEKQYRGLLSYLPLAEALERNPVAAVKRLAKIYDLRVVDDDGPDTRAATRAGTRNGKGRATSVDDGDDTKEFIDGILKDFKSDLGPELEYLADGLGPAMTKALQKMADRSVSTRVKSLEDATVELARSSSSAESDRLMESFYRTHKDHADYEDEMDALARQLVGEGENIRPIPMSEGEFLEFLYDTVKARRSASGQKDTIKAEAKRLMKKRLKKLATARSGDRRPTSVPEERVRRRPRGAVSIRDAYKAARNGITFDDEDDDGLD